MKHNLKCGCCGQVYSGEPDHNYDKGYGVCPECTEREIIRVNKQYDDIISEVLNTLNDSNRDKFASLTRDEQIVVINQLITERVITFKIK